MCIILVLSSGIGSTDGGSVVSETATTENIKNTFISGNFFFFKFDVRAAAAVNCRNACPRRILNMPIYGTYMDNLLFFRPTTRRVQR